MNLKISRYTRIVFVADDKWLVHNLNSGSECILSNKELSLMKSIDNSINDDFSELLNQLLEMGIVVESNVDENACLELERRINLYSFASGEVGFVIAPTMDCNARCFYCYENDTRKSCYMNEKTEKALVEYIKKTANEKKKLFISWFGGEPLLCKDVICRVSCELIDFCNKNSIAYEAELTSNGYYLDDFMDNLENCKITDTQITIDGYKEEYIKRKNYIDAITPWDKIINNIFKASLSGNHITLRINFDKKNISSVKKAVRYLISDQRWNDNISIYFYPLEQNFDGSNSDFIDYYSVSEYETIMAELYNYLYECNYYKNKEYRLDFHKLSLPCYGATLGVLAVDYDGFLYQCQHLLCRKEYAIGNVFSGVNITKDILDWYDGTVRDECRDCDVLPLCQGGCVTKPKIGQCSNACHMIKYRIKTQELLKAKLLFPQVSSEGGEHSEGRKKAEEYS